MFRLCVRGRKLATTFGAVIVKGIYTALLSSPSNVTISGDKSPIANFCIAHCLSLVIVISLFLVTTLDNFPLFLIITMARTRATARKIIWYLERKSLQNPQPIMPTSRCQIVVTRYWFWLLRKPSRKFTNTFILHFTLE
jgi:hypothetical protein